MVIEARSSNVKWAIAGRSKEKLVSLKNEISQELGDSDIMAVDVVIADTNDIDTLRNVVKDTRSVASTAGPFALYGRLDLSYLWFYKLVIQFLCLSLSSICW